MTERELFVVPDIGNPQWYSGASRFGDLVFTAGQVPVRPGGSVPNDFAEQVTAALDNLEATLNHVGANFKTLLKVNTYLTSLDDFPIYNEVYSERLAPSGLPPRTTVEIVRLPEPMRIEIEAVAHVGSGK